MIVIYKIVSSYLCKINLLCSVIREKESYREANLRMISTAQFYYCKMYVLVHPKESWHVVL